MKIIALRKEDQNVATIDPWTVVHFGFGLASGLMGFGFTASMLAATAYEVFEQALERSEFGQGVFQTSGPERLSNSIFDIVIFAGGHWLGRKWNES